MSGGGTPANRLFKPVLFNFSEAPTAETIQYVVGIAVRTVTYAVRATR